MISLDRLIEQFVDAQKDGHRARWRQVDLAAAAYAVAGARGLAKLAQASGLTPAYLRMFVRTAAAFPPGTRRFDLSFAHHLAAQRAVKRFPAGSREHEPHFWLDASVAQGYNCEQLRHAMDRHVLTDDSLEARQRRVTRTVADAQHYRDRLVADAAYFNTTYAVFWGSRLVVTEQALLTPAS